MVPYLYNLARDKGFRLAYLFTERELPIAKRYIRERLSGVLAKAA